MGNIFFERRGGKKLVAPISNHWRGAGMKIPIFLKKYLQNQNFLFRKRKLNTHLDSLKMGKFQQKKSKNLVIRGIKEPSRLFCQAKRKARFQNLCAAPIFEFVIS